MSSTKLLQFDFFGCWRNAKYAVILLNKFFSISLLKWFWRSCAKFCFVDLKQTPHFISFNFCTNHRLCITNRSIKRYTIAENFRKNVRNFWTFIPKLDHSVKYTFLHLSLSKKTFMLVSKGRLKWLIFEFDSLSCHYDPSQQKKNTFFIFNVEQQKNKVVTNLSPLLSSDDKRHFVCTKIMQNMTNKHQEW